MNGIKSEFERDSADLYLDGTDLGDAVSQLQLGSLLRRHARHKTFITMFDCNLGPEGAKVVARALMQNDSVKTLM
jgi:hypothetical protein